MSRRQITRPMSIPGADRYFRVRIFERRPDGEQVHRGYHNQPFRTYDAARFAVDQLWTKASKAGMGDKVAFAIVEVTVR